MYIFPFVFILPLLLGFDRGWRIGRFRSRLFHLSCFDFFLFAAAAGCYNLRGRVYGWKTTEPMALFWEHSSEVLYGLAIAINFLVFILSCKARAQLDKQKKSEQNLGLVSSEPST